MSKRYGIGVLGYGMVARWITEELAESDRFQIVAAFDPVVNESPYPMLASADEVARDPRVDCVYVASPPRWHREGVELAVRHGKALLCEKPLAPSIDEADQLATLVAGTGLSNVVNFGFQTSTTGRSLRAAVKDELLGRVERAEVRLRFAAWPQQWHAKAGPWLTTPEEGGFTREVLTHFMALADHALGAGAVERAEVVRGADGLETRTTADVRYGSVPLSVDAVLDPTVASDDDMTSVFTVWCERGRMAIEDWNTPVGIPLQDPRPGGLAPALARHLDGEESDLQDFAAGARVVRVIETILAQPTGDSR